MKSLVLPSFAGSGSGVVHFFGTRRGPDRLASIVKVGQVTASPPLYPRIASVKQVHGTEVIMVDQPLQIGDVLETAGDALVTNQLYMLVVVRTADCVPVLIADHKRKVIAAVHAGWRGSIAGIVPKTISVLQQRFGSRPEDLQMAIGPSIGVCCYEVDEPVIRQLQETFLRWHTVLEPVKSDRAKLNLKELIASQAWACGVLDSAISRTELCTQCRPDLFYSYRRAGTAKQTMLSGLMLTPGD